MDQHRPQIAAEWIETIAAEISRERIARRTWRGAEVLRDFPGKG
jgi:hypothetical protein